MKYLKLLVMAAVILLLAACGQMVTPEVTQDKIDPLSSVEEATASVGGSITTPVSVTTDGTAAALTVTFRIDGKQEGIATFKVYRDYAFNGTSWNPVNPDTNFETFTVTVRDNVAAAETRTANISLKNTGATTAANSTSTVRVIPFGLTNSNPNGAKLGLKDSATATIHVKFVAPTVVTPPNTAPSISLPANITEEATSAQGATVSFVVTAADTQDGNLNGAVTCTRASGSTFALGTTTVNCSVRDSGGLSASGSFTVTVVDTTAPVISGMPGDIIKEATGPDGANVSWTAPTASDIVTGSRPVTCDPASGSTFALGTNTVTCSASDGNGNTASQSFTVTVQDTTPPTLTDLGSTSPKNAAGWYSSAVTNTFKAADAVGFAEGFENPFTKSSGTAEGSAVKINSGSVSDAAGNEAQGIDSAAFQIDLTRPTVSVTGVSNGAAYTLGSVPAAACNTQDDLSGVATEASLSSSGGPIGSVTATCSGAVDVAGNAQAAPVSVTYNVIYNFTGFFSPVDMNGVYNVAKAGSAIPVKFKLGGDYGLGVISKIASYKIACPSTIQTDLVEETAAGTTSGLKYDATADQYNYTWKTATSLAGTCQRLDMQLNDGSTVKTAFFKFNK